MSNQPATDAPENGGKPAETSETSAKAPSSDDGTAKSEAKKREPQSSSAPVVSPSKRTRPPYKYDPSKVTLRFLFANRDGLTVTVECNPSDTIGEVKGALLSVWPEGTSNSKQN